MKRTECASVIYRTSCIKCALKHLMQARVLVLEMDNYPKHWWKAMGHMAEAEDELRTDFPSKADMVRDDRIILENDKTYGKLIDWDEWIDVLEGTNEIPETEESTG